MYCFFILIFFRSGTEEGYLSHDRILKLSVRFWVSKCHSSINITKYIIFQCRYERCKSYQRPGVVNKGLGSSLLSNVIPEFMLYFCWTGKTLTQGEKYLITEGRQFTVEKWLILHHQSGMDKWGFVRNGIWTQNGQCLSSRSFFHPPALSPEGVLIPPNVKLEHQEDSVG